MPAEMNLTCYDRRAEPVLARILRIDSTQGKYQKIITLAILSDLTRVSLYITVTLT
jgi:hypothetical protein